MTITTIAHSVATIVRTGGGHDLTPFLAPLVAAIPVTLVAAFSLVVTARQNRRTLALTKRQVTNDERKVQSDLYDRRYAAWEAMSDAADTLFKAILNLKVDESLEPELWVAFNAAAGRIAFLFSDSAVAATNALGEELQRFNAARIGMHYPNPHIDNFKAVMDEFNISSMRCDQAKVALKDRLREETGIYAPLA